MRRLFFLFALLCTTLCSAQYKHLGVSDGLSSRKIYFIQKGKMGYMWFLTHEGIDRYNGKGFKHYSLTIDGKEVNSRQDLNWLYTDTEGNLWQMGKRGRVFKYNDLKDDFEVFYQLPPSESAHNPTPITYGFIDKQHYIWLYSDTNIFRIHTESKEVTQMENKLGTSITYAIQHDDTHFFLGTESGLYYVELRNGALHTLSIPALDELTFQVNELYLDNASRQLFIGTFQRGIYIYNITTQTCDKIPTTISDLTITRIKALNTKEVLIATNGAGVYKMNINTHKGEAYIVADYNESNMMTGNNVNDIYIDTVGRIWIANFPIGLTIRDDRYSQYRWIKNSIGNPQSLVNDRVNAFIEDHEGDLWFATGNGVSLYEFRTKKWTAFLSTFNRPVLENNHTYLSICEATPGVIYVGGYSSTVHQIEKKTGKITTLPLDSYKKTNTQADKYIKAIKRDQQGQIWMGGYYNLKKVDLQKKEIQRFPELNNITTILEKDKDNMWIGSSKGLYLLNKVTGESTRMNLPIESTYIYALCQTPDNRLYIGTNGAGLLVYNLENESFTLFHKDNSALLSNNIYAIACDGHDNIVFSTESGLTRFFPREDEFQNWTTEQGLNTIHFSPDCGILRKDNQFMFGSSDGIIAFSKDIHLPRNYESKMILSDFKLFYESTYPSKEGSPLKQGINETEVLKLDANQNIFSLEVSSINYDYSSNTLYSWKLEGFYDNWTRPSRDNIVRFTNLNPGNYNLRIRAISNENRRIIEERSMKIIVAPPFWRSTWAFFIYLALIALSLAGISRILFMRRQRILSEEKFQFFTNTAHDIRTPLTLIKAPLEEIQKKEQLSEAGSRNMQTAVRNVDVLLRLTTNLINFERMDLHSSELYIAEYELNTFMNDIMQSFYAYAEVKNLQLTYESNFSYMTVWFDKEKMESVVKNIISNALKYTPGGGSVKVVATETEQNWEIEVTDTGIGIPSSEQKKVFKSHFRGTNAINSKITGSGIGMVLVAKQVELHKGKITLKSTEQKGTTIKMVFPKGRTQFKKVHTATGTSKPSLPEVAEETVPATFIHHTVKQKANNGQRILIVEDNDELRGYLRETLSEEYMIQTCENGKEALIFIKDYMPDLVISDIMMPEMRGDELCQILKNDIETSHIPIILLTALNDEQNVVKGLSIGADDYVIKPFNTSILKATIANILNNRALLRSRYAKLEFEDSAEEACTNCSTDIDWKFIAQIKKNVEDNMDDPQFNIDMLAANMNMSRTSLYNKIKALTDLSPSDYVRTIKLTKAAELLMQGELNVTEVAERTGFSDAKYFREVFKKQYNVSPSKYRQKQ